MFMEEHGDHQELPEYAKSKIEEVSKFLETELKKKGLYLQDMGAMVEPDEYDPTRTDVVLMTTFRIGSRAYNPAALHPEQYEISDVLETKSPLQIIKEMMDSDDMFPSHDRHDQ